MRNPDSGIGCAILSLIAVAVVIVGVVTVGINMEWGTQTNVTFTVTSLSATSSSNGSMNYKVFTPNEVFDNSDAWFHGKTDSSNVYNQFLQWGDGAVVTCPVYGFRNTFMSSYRDILDGCKLVKQGARVNNQG